MATQRIGGISPGHKALIAMLVLVVGFLPAYWALTFLLERLETFFEIREAQVFGVVLIAILLEAFPFVLLGSLVSGTIEVLVPAETLRRFVPKRRAARLAMAPLLGIVFPVCECGVVPVVRRLLRKGLPLEMAVVYLLAGPIVNPIVIASTIMAFLRTPTAWAMPIGRVAVGVVVAMAVGLVLARRDARRRSQESVRDDAANPPETETEVEPAVGAPPRRKAGDAVAAILHHTSTDFLLLGGFLLLGAMIAATAQAFVPRDVLVSVGKTPVVSSAAMMLLAFALNLCSEADAFVAASFVQFSFAAKLAFLVLGPMLDVKLVAMYLGALPRRVLVAVVVMVPVLVLVLSEAAGLLHGLLFAAAGAG